VPDGNGQDGQQLELDVRLPATQKQRISMSMSNYAFLCLRHYVTQIEKTGFYMNFSNNGYVFLLLKSLKQKNTMSFLN